MNAVLEKLKRTVDQVRGLLPSALPCTGTTAFEAWASSIENTYNLPTKDKDSIRFVLTTAIMHLGPTVAFKPKYHFVLLIRASAAKQVAGAVFQEIKNNQKAKQAEAEATAAKVASDGPKQ